MSDPDAMKSAMEDSRGQTLVLTKKKAAGVHSAVFGCPQCSWPRPVLYFTNENEDLHNQEIKRAQKVGGAAAVYFCQSLQERQDSAFSSPLSQ